ncbi:hypothetical protein [Paenibacillus ehimensis]|uniref:WYL domain-containing protein n=1 Tax=Paenibacillus ehimensis TaxID=79264 RepID=A0ABT8VEM9_9BACL|nr:hypothetical protein [Paenibacillus ehimensis]MDO3679435.1 hypothetical protein [Paenibacillus ehimensis]MEC0208901.1 hypothetical protein [Paenibacillus ehimensis]
MEFLWFFDRKSFITLIRAKKNHRRFVLNLIGGFHLEYLEGHPIRFEWKPAELDEQEFFIINWLCINGVLDISEPGFKQWLVDRGSELEKIVESLTKKFSYVPK